MKGKLYIQWITGVTSGRTEVIKNVKEENAVKILNKRNRQYILSCHFESAKGTKNVLLESYK